MLVRNNNNNSNNNNNKNLKTGKGAPWISATCKADHKREGGNRVALGAKNALPLLKERQVGGVERHQRLLDLLVLELLDLQQLGPPVYAQDGRGEGGCAGRGGCGYG